MMKTLKLVITAFAALIVVACSAPKAPAPDVATVQIDTLLNRWHRAAAVADFNGYFGALDSLSVYIGTDAGEVWSKQQFMEYSKPYFDRGRAWDFKLLRRSVYFSKNCDMAWFNETLDTWMGLCTASGVLEFNGNGWVIKHYLLSIAIPNEVVKEVVMLKAPIDSSQLKQMSPTR